MKENKQNFSDWSWISSNTYRFNLRKDSTQLLITRFMFLSSYKTKEIVDVNATSNSFLTM